MLNFITKGDNVEHINAYEKIGVTAYGITNSM